MSYFYNKRKSNYSLVKTQQQLGANTYFTAAGGPDRTGGPAYRRA